VVPATTSAIAPEFVRQCELELTKVIGPIAPLIVQRILSQQKDLSPNQLMDTLVAHVPDPEAGESFRRKLQAW
jgi:serine/threonine-protein kinase